jgi:hypothetical protein
MDVEKTIEFLLEHQARFEANLATFAANFEADMKQLRESQRATERLINAFAKAGQAQIELHRTRMDSLERRLEMDEERFQAFLKRFDTFLQGRQGDGQGA